MEFPSLVVSDESDRIFEINDYEMAGMSLNLPIRLADRHVIQLPFGSTLFRLPGRIPIAFDPRQGKHVEICEYHGKPVSAVAAFMAPAYLQLYRAAFRRLPNATRLPLYSYTAAGWLEGAFCASGIRIDTDVRQDLDRVDLHAVAKNAYMFLKKHPGNRLVEHLVEKCVLQYGCPAARNLVMKRWECPLPTSPGCNSRCIGCISKQDADNGVISSQERISFIPKVEEIVQIAVPHLEKAPRAIVSFGQGCEGEPLLVGGMIEESIRAIRRRTDRGVININTNGSNPEMIVKLCESGLDSMRVSLNSAQNNYYTLYHKPQNYSFENVIESLKIVRQFGKWSSINYFMFPGFTDNPVEMAALINLVKSVKLNMIQTRNLNMDPELYIEELDLGSLSAESVGLMNWIVFLREKLPQLVLGYFNPPREGMMQMREYRVRD